MQFTTIHPETLNEIKDDARDIATDPATSNAYRVLMSAFADYLARSAQRDVYDVAGEMEHLQRRISRLLQS